MSDVQKRQRKRFSTSLEASGWLFSKVMNSLSLPPIYPLLRCNACPRIGAIDERATFGRPIVGPRQVRLADPRRGNWRCQPFRLGPARTRVGVLSIGDQPSPIPFFSDHRHQPITGRGEALVGKAFALDLPTPSHCSNVASQELHVDCERRVGRVPEAPRQYPRVVGLKIGTSEPDCTDVHEIDVGRHQRSQLMTVVICPGLREPGGEPGDGFPILLRLCCSRCGCRGASDQEASGEPVHVEKT